MRTSSISQTFLNDYSNIDKNKFNDFVAKWKSWSALEYNSNKVYIYKISKLLDTTNLRDKPGILPQKICVNYYGDTISPSSNNLIRTDSLYITFEECGIPLYFNNQIKKVLDRYFYIDNKKVNIDNLKEASLYLNLTYLKWGEELSIESLRYLSFPNIYRVDIFTNGKLIYCQTRWDSYKILLLDKEEYDLSKGHIVEEWYED